MNKQEQKEFTDKLCAEVAAIGGAVQNLDKSIKRHALVVLIQANCRHRLSREVIETVLDGVGSLETFVFKKTKDSN